MLHLRLRSLGLAKADVLADAEVEQNGLLRDESNLRPMPGRCDCFQVVSIDGDSALRWIIEPFQEAYKCRLSTSGLANDSGDFASGYIEREPSDDFNSFARWVRKVNVLELDMPCESTERQQSNVRVEAGRASYESRKVTLQIDQPTNHLSYLA